VKYQVIVLVVIMFGGGINTLSAESQFQPGQEWSYKSRPVDAKSTLVVGSIETDSNMGDIVHITVKNVQVTNPNAEGGFATHIGHIPMSIKSLEDSVIKKLSDDEQADGIAEGIEAWREAKGGVFTISVSEAVQYIEDVLTDGEIVNE
jgi:hypothetical protein